MQSKPTARRKTSKRKPGQKAYPPIPPAELARLRAVSAEVRAAIERDREQIEEEARRSLAEAVARGDLIEIINRFSVQRDQYVVDAIDAYATKHSLVSRAQVVRAALSKLLKIDLPVAKRGPKKGRARKS